MPKNLEFHAPSLPLPSLAHKLFWELHKKGLIQNKKELTYSLNSMNIFITL